MARLDEERQKELQPIRHAKAKEEITKLGYTITFEDPSVLIFYFKNNKVKYFPYSGWATGKKIKDGRGLKNLLNQIKK